MTNAELIAVEMEMLLEKARSLKVNVFALVQSNETAQGAVYYYGDPKTMYNLLESIKQEVIQEDQIRMSQPKREPQVISYGL